MEAEGKNFGFRNILEQRENDASQDWHAAVQD